VQVFTLVYPLVLRRVVDGAATAAGPSTDALAAGLALLGVGFLLAQVGRLLTLTAVQRVVDVRLTLGVLGHLAALPFSFFARRSTGDLTLRVRSTFAIRQLLTTSALSAVLDGTLVLGYLGVIAAVDLRFAALTAAAIALQVLVVVATWRRLRQSAAEALEAQTASQSGLLELVAGFELLKASGAAQQAVEDWSVRLRSEVRAQARNARTAGLVDSALATVRFLTPPALLVLGLSRVNDGTLELGDMLAVAALSAAVTVPVGALLGTICALTSVLGYLERLDDVLDAPAEESGERSVPERLSGAVALAGVSFRYSPLLPPAVRDISLAIAPGGARGSRGRVRFRQDNTRPAHRRAARPHDRRRSARWRRRP
jgi:ABC-type bacteriocin/lantibiotic exporter with double-glycine peptidase domain